MTGASTSDAEQFDGSRPVSPTFRRAAIPLVMADFLAAAWFTPPDPYSQVRWGLPGLVVALVVAWWFARSGADRLDATAADLWLFVTVSVLLLVAVQAWLDGASVPTTVEAFVAGAVALVAGWLAFAPGAERLRRRAYRW